MAALPCSAKMRYDIAQHYSADSVSPHCTHAFAMYIARMHFSGFYRMPAKLRRKLKPHSEEHIAAVKDEVVAEELLFEVVIVFVKPVHNFARFGVGRILP